ncbi:hypothetical protein MYA_4368 [Burkholderia sp. KJ006]|nr:hypothetical protein MYA_4368 [Burkholderia sp. KJ006]
MNVQPVFFTENLDLFCTSTKMRRGFTPTFESAKNLNDSL